MVTLAWILGKPLSLLFDPFESIVRQPGLNFITAALLTQLRTDPVPFRFDHQLHDPGWQIERKHLHYAVSVAT